MNKTAMLQQKMSCSSEEEPLLPLSSGAPCPALGSPGQERQAATGEGPAEGCGDEEGTRAPPL